MIPNALTPDGTNKTKRRGNCRATIRYRCAPATIGRVFSTDDHDFQIAWILDLSLTGIGIQVTRQLDPGQHITVMLRSCDNQRRFTLSAHVVHCDAQPQGEFIAGCELNTPLTPDDLDQLL